MNNSTPFERDYFNLLNRYKNNEWKSLKEKHEMRIELEVFEELNEKLYKEKIRRKIYEKYFNENNESY